MEEKTKKRSRKTKLVPREYVDSDDENIAKMQDEIEETIAQMNPLSILRKLEPKQPQKDMEFSIKVEVEEVDQNVKEELKHTEDLQDLDLNIKIHSVKSLCKPTQDTPNMSDDVYDVFNIDEDEIREDFESLSQETTSLADKIIEIYLKNTFGKKHLFIAQSPLDQLLQKKLKTWRSWYKSNPQIRDAPLMYICYVCIQGWWNFSEFREHLSHCRKWKYLNTDMTHYQATLIATIGKKVVANGSAIPTFDSNCWKCNKDGLFHLKSQYVCGGCNTEFRTCTALSFHEGECKMYRKKIFLIKGMDVENNLAISYHCPICSYKDWDKDLLIIHIKNVHSVRSDLPIDWTTKVCKRCNLHYHESTGHHCSLRTSMKSCASCMANFQTLLGLTMHVNNSVDDYKCKLCNKILQKSCMELEHMLEHTDNYMQLFKCPLCPEPMYFLYEKFAKHHKSSVHRDHLDRMPLWLYGYKVIIPKRLFERLQPIKNKPAQPPAILDGSNDLDDHHAHIDKYSQDLRDTQEQPDLETPRAPETRSLIDAENGVEITIINKSTLQELSDAVVAEIKAKELITEQCKIVTKPEIIIKIPDKKTYVNKKISNTNNLADKIEVEVNDIKNTKEIESDNIIKVKEELMDTDELDVNIEVKNEVYNGVTNFVDIEVKSESVDEVHAIESCEVEIKQESEDFRDYEPDIISWGDMNNGEGTEDAVEDTCHKRRRRKANVPYIPKAIFTDKYECTKCNKAWPTLNKYLLHFSEHNYKPRTCPQCLKYCHGSRTKHVFTHVKRLFVMTHSIEHWKAKAQRNYRCKKCKEALGVKEFFRHWESHLDINDNTVSEPQCPVDMTEKPHLNEMIELLQGHEYSETWKLRYCQVCNKRILRQNDCKRHYIEHLLADAYQEKYKYGALMCQICGDRFQKKMYYKRHMRDHASLPVYICEICDKTFSDSSNFCKHKKVHNLAVLICDICKKKFNNKMCLIRHIELHQLIKPINCKTCEKVFYTQSSYRKHLKSNQSRFKCVICNTIYYSLKDKWDHMWQVHKERKYEADCPLCDKSFRKFQDVKQHLRREHSEDKVRLEQAELAISILKSRTAK